MDVLVVDDGSPDGTGDLADRMAAADPQVTVLHRAGKAASARRTSRASRSRWRAATTWSGRWTPTAPTSRSSSPPCSARSSTPTWSSARAGCPAGRWSTGRCRARCCRVGGNLYARLLLGIPLRDITAGYRLFRRSTLETIDLGSVQSAGYIFQTDLAFRTLRAGLRVVEVPIQFVERVRGESKMSRDVAVESLWRITVVGSARAGRQLRDVLLRRPSERGVGR